MKIFCQKFFVGCEKSKLGQKIINFCQKPVYLQIFWVTYFTKNERDIIGRPII